MNDWAAIDWKLVQRERKTEEWVREKDAEDIAKAIMELEDAVEEMQDTRAELEAENAQLRAELAALREHWAHSNPGLADQYRAEAFACRSTLGFDVDSDEVSPRELVDAIKAQPASPEGREQEPVAWIVEHDDYPTEVELHDQFDHTPEARKKDEAMGWRFTPLYKAPLSATQQENNNGN